MSKAFAKALGSDEAVKRVDAESAYRAEMTARAEWKAAGFRIHGPVFITPHRGFFEVRALGAWQR